MNIKTIIPIQFELVLLLDGSPYFRTNDGRWYRALGDKDESNFRDKLEAVYQQYVTNQDRF